MTENSRTPRILVVDDHELGRRSLARLLEAVGYEVTSVKDGRTALEAMNTTVLPDYVLTDVRLPDLDGREVVQAAQRLNPRPRIAFITGWDLSDKERRDLGIDWVFLKPLNIREIIARLQEADASTVLVAEPIGKLGSESGSSS